ncbi:MAG: hypothetical protein JWN70_6335 [Planctomycetaceae bacterium]|nr:hypothetical protein [Planctomycetaceae bacterium]
MVRSSNLSVKSWVMPYRCNLGSPSASPSRGGAEASEHPVGLRCEAIFCLTPLEALFDLKLVASTRPRDDDQPYRDAGLSRTSRTFVASDAGLKGFWRNATSACRIP